MNLTKIVSENLLISKNLRKISFVILCILIFYLTVSAYNRFMTNQKIEQIQIQGLKNLAEIHTAKIKLLNSKIDLLNSEIEILKENKK
jgi:hypothetical protein